MKRRDDAHDNAQKQEAKDNPDYKKALDNGRYIPPPGYR